jgi:hypothetical protein
MKTCTTDPGFTIHTRNNRLHQQSSRQPPPVRPSSPLPSPTVPLDRRQHARGSRSLLPSPIPSTPNPPHMRPDLLVVGEFGSAAMEVARSRAPRPAPIEVSGHPSTIRCCRHAPRLQVAPARGMVSSTFSPFYLCFSWYYYIGKHEQDYKMLVVR